MGVSRSQLRFAVVLAGLLASLLGLTVLMLAPLPAPPPISTPAVAERARESRPANAPAGSFSLEGRLTAAAGGWPTPGAAISVTRESDGLDWTTTTDHDGRWKVSGLPEGAYGVTATKQGYRTESAWMPPLTLSSARPTRTLDLQISRGGVFAGRVSNGRGDPLPDVTVAVLRVSRDDQRVSYQFQGEMTDTDENGQFRLSGVRDGEYVLAVSRRYQVVRPDEPAFATTYLPDTVNPTEARRFTITDGAEYAGLHLVARAVVPRRATGRVVTSERVRGGRIDVSYRRLDETSGAGWQGGVVSSWPGPPDGTFDYRLLPGRYRFTAKAEAGEGVWEVGTLDVSLADRDVTELILHTHAPARIQGRLVPERMGTWTGVNLRLAVLSVDVGTSGESLPEEPPRVVPDGTFEIRAAGTSGRLVLIQPSNGWEILKVTRAGRELAGAVLAFKDGETVEGIEVTLRRRASVIEGTLATPGSSECVVVLARSDRGIRCVTSMNVREGEFRSLPIVAGSYRVAATCATREPPETLEELWARATPIDLADDQVKTVRLDDANSARAPANR